MRGRSVARYARAVVLAVRFVVVLGALEVALRVTSVPRAARAFGVPLLEDGGPSDGDFDLSSLDDDEVLALRVLRRALRLPGVNGTCLRSSVLAGRVLRSRSPRLVLGVTKADGVVRAHAWLRVAGRDLDLERGSGYRVLAVGGKG